METEHANTNKRPLIFLGVGFLNTFVDFSFYTLLTSTAFRNGNHIALAGLISGTFALGCSFLTHGLITWRGSHLSHKTMAKFVIFTGFGMWVIRPILLSLFIHLSRLYAFAQRMIDYAPFRLSYNFIANAGAFALMLVIVLTYNYFVYEHFVFTEIKPRDIAPENH